MSIAFFPQDRHHNGDQAVRRRHILKSSTGLPIWGLRESSGVIHGIALQPANVLYMRSSLLGTFRSVRFGVRGSTT